MQSKKKIGLFSCVAFLIIVIYIFRLIPWRSYNHHGNVFEYDEYGDGDYDERARIDHARKHVPKWNYTKENIGIFIRPRHDWMVNDNQQNRLWYRVLCWLYSLASWSVNALYTVFLHQNSHYLLLKKQLKSIEIFFNYTFYLFCIKGLYFYHAC